MNSLLSQNKKTKWLFTLSIQELANIPQISGKCYVKWHIKETAKQGLKGKSEKASIKNYRATWSNSSVESIIKMSVNKAKELQEKVLQLVVYIEYSDSKDNSKDGNKRSVLGKVDINLAEYANYDEPTTNRYLLQDSKVNCILNVKIGMELIKGDKDEFIPPKVKSNSIFKGISTVFNESSSVTAPHSPTTNNSTSSSNTHSNANNTAHTTATTASKAGSSKPTTPQTPHSHTSNSQMSSEKYHHSITISSDPVLSKLYERTFEIPWDPRPGEFNAQECVDDIFNGGNGWAKNEDGENLIDLKNLKLKENFESNNNNSNRNNNGNKVLKESDIRQDLKSWKITTII